MFLRYGQEKNNSQVCELFFIYILLSQFLI